MPNGIDDAAFLRELFDKAPLPYQSLDAQGRFLRVNAAFCALLGFAESEILGRDFADILAPDSRKALPERFEALKREGAMRRAMFWLVRKDGSLVPVELNGTVAVDAAGRFVRTHCIFTDISERLFAERRLRASEQRYRRLVELAHEGIWQIDAEAATVFVNPAMAAMLERRPEEMVGHSLFEFMDAEWAAQARAQLQERRSGHSEQFEFTFRTRTGRELHAAVAAGPILDDAGNYQGALAGVIDMTAQHLLNQRVLRAQKLEGLEVMARGIAHDFNNLLQTILGNAELAQASDDLGAGTAHALAAIERASHEAADLCRQMLSYAGRGVYAMQSLRMDDLVTDIEGLLRATITRKAELRLEIASDLPPVAGDRAQLRQVIVNLVTNAAESLGGHAGRIVVSTDLCRLETGDAGRILGNPRAEGGDYVVLAVADTGSGIGPEALASVFDPFYSTKFTGRGLGLAVVRGVALAHGGGVTVESEPGNGSRFELWLPAAIAPTAAARPSASPAAALGEGIAAGRTLLVADDDEELRDLLLRMVERLGWDAVGVPDGAAAVAAVAEAPGRFAAVVLDWAMPVMDGREALEAIRLAVPGLPVFMSSGHAVDGLAADVAHLRPSGFLAKPYRLSELQHMLASVESPVG
ncbi:MAG TPA: PAS domain S-box protein [Candidatus Krumholzibacteria bacterium]|nr:PAS domain S-box protein [Candidatus Krumholzibacteria bacterium]